MQPWPYAGKRSIVVTSRTITDLPVDAQAWASGVDALADHLPARAEQEVWIVGGGLLQQTFFACDALDRLDQFIVPVILGGGIPLCPDAAEARTLKLAEVGRFGEVAHLRLERARTGSSTPLMDR